MNTHELQNALYIWLGPNLSEIVEAKGTSWNKRIGSYTKASLKPKGKAELIFKVTSLCRCLDFKVRWPNGTVEYNTMSEALIALGVEP